VVYMDRKVYIVVVDHLSLPDVAHPGVTGWATRVDCRDVKRLSVYRLSFIFLVLVFEFQKSIIVSNLELSS